MDAERGTAEGAGAGAGSSLLQKLNLPLLLEQTLHVSVSSHCLSRAEMCEPPRVHTVAAYRSSDVSLAQFLTAALPARNRRCADPECSGGPAGACALVHPRRGQADAARTEPGASPHRRKTGGARPSLPPPLPPPPGVSENGPNPNPFESNVEST